MDVPPPPVLLDRIKALPAAIPLLERLGDAEGVHLVGGAVRDLLLGGQPSDLDLVVEGDAATLARRLGPSTIHDRFGTSTVDLDGFSYDIARARRERYPQPGALPDVEPAPLAEDLLRRDFTVNAIAVALAGAGAGQLTPAPNAVQDLADGLLRILHPSSFTDDPTRLLRLARYASRLRFEIDPHTRELAQAAVENRALDTVSGSRIGNELRLAAREPDPVAAFEKLAELELDAAVHHGFGLRDRARAHRALELLPPDARQDLLVLGLAARRVEPAALRGLLDRLDFEARERQVIQAVALDTEELAQALQQATGRSQIALAAMGAPSEAIAAAGALGAAAEARAWLADVRHVRLEIDGRDLISAGVPEGPAVGAGLRAALAAKLEGATNGREDELRWAVRAATGSG